MIVAVDEKSKKENKEDQRMVPCDGKSRNSNRLFQLTDYEKSKRCQLEEDLQLGKEKE